MITLREEIDGLMVSYHYKKKHIKSVNIDGIIKELEEILDRTK
jgi:hypothetical protein